MFKVGLTGGIGSGKSTVAAMLKDAGFAVVDADQVARDNMAPGSPVLQRVAEAFGSDILNDCGELDRAELARRAFSSESQTNTLNAITHPAIRSESNRRFAELKASGTRVAVYDMPLLIELGLDAEMDLTVVVDVDAEERINRLVHSRGLDEVDARNRIERQIDDAARRSRADVVIDNNGTQEALEPQITSLVARINQVL